MNESLQDGCIYEETINDEECQSSQNFKWMQQNANISLNAKLIQYKQSEGN